MKELTRLKHELQKYHGSQQSERRPDPDAERGGMIVIGI